MKSSLKNALAAIGLCSLVSALIGCQSTDRPAAPVSEGAAIISSAPYAVGSSTIFIHDDSRPFDTVAGVNSGVRTLITEIWYPVAHADITDSSIRATYGDYVFGNRTIHHKMLTQTTFFHLTQDTVREGVTAVEIEQAIDELFSRPRGSYIDAPILKGVQPLPVVVMSHGDAGSRYNMQTVCEHLASQGYIVVAPEHTGNSPYTMIGMDPALDEKSGNPVFRRHMAEVLLLLDEQGAYGDDEHFGQSYSPLGDSLDIAGFVDLDHSLVERVNDLRAVLNTLDDMNEQGAFTGRIDPSRIGLMGRSFGGATTLAGLMLEDRFVAGFAVVPPSLPDPRALMPQEMLVKLPQESAILAAEGSFALDTLHKPTLLLSGGEDHLILGMGYQMATMMEGTLPTADNPYPILKQAMDKSEVPAVMAIVQNTNHGSFGVAAPYWWPLLKPDTFPMFFDNSRQYTLLEADIAHQIQQDMALAFFNFNLRGDQSGAELLRENPWQAHETQVEVRGF
ncbi:MAG: acetylhydrolase [Halioglobus sp.]